MNFTRYCKESWKRRALSGVRLIMLCFFFIGMVFAACWPGMLMMVWLAAIMPLFLMR